MEKSPFLSLFLLFMTSMTTFLYPLEDLEKKNKLEI
jgi:hypothetical protein